MATLFSFCSPNENAHHADRSPSSCAHGRRGRLIGPTLRRIVILCSYASVVFVNQLDTNWICTTSRLIGPPLKELYSISAKASLYIGAKAP